MCSCTSEILFWTKIMLPLKLLSCFFFFSLIFYSLDFFPRVVKCSAACLLMLPNNFSLRLIFLFSFSLFTGICFLYSFTKQGIPQAVLPPLPKRPALEKTNGATAVFNTGIFQYQQALANMQLQQHTAFLPPGKGWGFLINESDDLQRVLLLEQINHTPSLFVIIDEVSGKVVNDGNLSEVSHVVFLKK